MHGESGSVSELVIGEAITGLKQLTNNYAWKDIYNTDKTGLFCSSRETEERDMAIEDEDESHQYQLSQEGNHSKEVDNLMKVGRVLEKLGRIACTKKFG